MGIPIDSRTFYYLWYTTVLHNQEYSGVHYFQRESLYCSMMPHKPVRIYMEGGTRR